MAYVRSTALFYTNTPLFDRSPFTTAALPYVLFRRACKYRVNSTGPGQSFCLKGGGGRRRGPTTYLCGVEASGTLEADEVEEQYVRLIQVADNAQLRLMLETGVELCGGDAALYVRVDPTCPIYWVRWDNRKSKSDLDIVCDIPHRGVRATMLEKVQFNADSTGGVKIRHARNKPSETSTSSSLGALLVSTACGRIVGSKNFSRRSPRGDESGDEEKDEEENKED